MSPSTSPAAAWRVARITVVAALATGATGVTSAGCHSCKNEHPYVPFSIDGSDVDEGDASATDVPDLGFDAGGKFAEEPADVAPPMSAKWSLGGVDLVASPGHLFALGLVRDFDGDGKLDAFAVLFPAEGKGLGQVVFYRGEAGPKAPSANAPATNVLGAPIVVLNSPDELDAACVPVPRLARIGRRSVEAELASKCTGHTRSPPRVFAVLAAPETSAPSGTTARVRFSTKIVDPPGTPSLRLDADGADRDGDGIEDVALTATLEGGTAPFEPGPKLSATVRWFDRPAGLSQDPEEPEASLRALSTLAASKATRAKESSAPAIAGYVRQIRFLYMSLCGDARAPRVQPTVGTGPIACATSRALEEAGYAEGRAYAITGDALRAAAYIDRAPIAPATRTSARFSDAVGWLKNVTPTSEASQVRAVSAVPALAPSARAPAWGALAFEPSGKLLVRTASGVVRVDPAAGDEADAPDVQLWKWQATAALASDVRFSDAVSACDGTAAHAGFVSAGEPIDLGLPVGPFLASRCTNGRGDALSARPIAWGTLGLETFVANEPILISADITKAGLLAAPLDQPTPHGSPRSPSGKAVVLPASFGLVVAVAESGARGRLLVAKELDGSYAELRDCTVSDDATRVACVRGNRVAVGIWPAP
jgi:hypothetical protein